MPAGRRRPWEGADKTLFARCLGAPASRFSQPILQVAGRQRCVLLWTEHEREPTAKGHVSGGTTKE